MKQRILQIMVLVNAIVLLCVLVVLRSNFLNINKTEKSFNVMRQNNINYSSTIDTALNKSKTYERIVTDQSDIPSNSFHQFDTVSHLNLMSSSKTLIITEPIAKEFQYTLDTFLIHLRKH